MSFRALLVVGLVVSASLAGLTDPARYSALAAETGCDDACLEKLLSQIESLKKEVRRAIPVGTILPYTGGAALPPGFRPCDGEALDREKFNALFAVVGFGFTPANERSGSSFRLPDLRGRTIIGSGKGMDGNGKDLSSRQLGESLGLERVGLSPGELPSHVHSGTTGTEDKGHSHSGTTGDDSPDHSHGLGGYSFGVSYGGGNTSHNLSVPANNFHRFTDGANTRHKHGFATGPQSENHRHPFATDGGSGLKGLPHENMQPSLVLNFMIKAE